MRPPPASSRRTRSTRAPGRRLPMPRGPATTAPRPARPGRPPGKYGGALSFNGTSARVNIPNSSSLQLTTAMTLEAWVNPTTVSSRLARRHLQGQRQLLPRRHVRQREQAGRRRHIRGRRRRCVRRSGAGREHLGAPGAHLRRSHAPALRQRHAGRHARRRPARSPTSTNQLQIGGDSLYGQYFSGLIDEVRVYNIALSAAAIQTDMNTPIAGRRRHDPAVGAGHVDGVGRELGRDRSLVGCRDGQRRCHRVSDLPLPGRGLHDVRVAGVAGGNRDDVQGLECGGGDDAIATRCGRRMLPATSGRSRTSCRQRRRRGPTRRRRRRRAR